MIDLNAPMTWIETEILNLLNTAVSGVSGAIVNLIMPIVSICFGMYIIMQLIGYSRGAVSDPAIDFITRIVSFILVLSIGLSIADYNNYIFPMVTGFAQDLQCTVSSCNTATGSTTMDVLGKHYVDILKDGMIEAASKSTFDKIIAYIDVFFKFILIIIGLAPFLILATFSIILAKSFLVLVAAVGPIFFAFLLFPSTKQYFSAWLNTVISYSLVPLFVALITLVSIEISKKMLTDTTTGILDTSYAAIIFSSLGNLILMLLVREISGLASSLSAGGMNMGIPSVPGAGTANYVKNRMAHSAVSGLGSKLRSGAGRLTSGVGTGFSKAKSFVSNKITKAG